MALGVVAILSSVLVNASAMADGLDEIPVDSFESLETEAFRQMILSAAEAREVWVYDALQVALRLVGPFEGRSQSIMRSHDAAEDPRRAEIVVIEDGYLDDSVRGARYHFTLETDTQGIWRPIVVQRAWRCWPNRGHETFAKEPCL